MSTTFHPEHDLLVVMGPNVQERVRESLDKGLKRLILMLPKEDAGEGYPPVTAVVRSVRELRAAISELVRPAPRVAMVDSAEDLDPKVFKKIAAECGSVIDAMHAQQATLEVYSSAWMVHGNAAIEAVKRRGLLCARTKGSNHKGSPIVVVGAGPSLTRAIERLEAVQDKVTIIAIAHCMPALRVAGIVPDYVISVDPDDDTVQKLPEKLADKTQLILAMTSPPAMWELYDRTPWAICVNVGWDKWIWERLEAPELRVDCGGSAATAAIALAGWWQCDPIILVGQDYALTAQRDVYAKGLEHLNSKGPAFKVLSWVTGNPCGKPLLVPVTRSLMQFRMWIEDSGLPIWQCSEQGAKIAGAEHLPFDEALEEVLR